MAKDDIKDHGTIVHWNDSFGFIKADGGGHTDDIFVHVSQIAPGLQPKRGARVSYHLAPDRRRADRLMAVDVMVGS
jgi:cold shock CspA family protein